MAKETYIYEDGKRDLQKQDQASTAATRATKRHKKHVHVKRDMLMSKETYEYEDAKRDLQK